MPEGVEGEGVEGGSAEEEGVEGESVEEEGVEGEGEEGLYIQKECVGGVCTKKVQHTCNKARGCAYEQYLCRVQNTRSKVPVQ